MVKVGIIGTGSDNNSFLIESSTFSFVIDNGFSLKDFTKRAVELDLELKKLKYIFLTHIHNDHRKGIGILSRKFMLPVVHHKGLIPELIDSTGIYSSIKFDYYKAYKVNDQFQFFTFKTYHDSPYSTGFSFILEDYNITLITDTGHLDKVMLNLAIKSDILFLEANYDDQMLINGPYPYYLKQRISSEYGHLSNSQSIEFIKNLFDKIMKTNKDIFICHLSDQNNTVEKVYEKFKETFSNVITEEIYINEHILNFKLVKNQNYLNIFILKKNIPFVKHYQQKSLKI